MPLLLAELEARAVQRVPRLQLVVSAAQPFAPVLLVLPAGLATQLHPAWVGGQVRSRVGVRWAHAPAPRHSHSPVKSSAVPRS